ncbi:hypothetical protein ACI6QG_09030 [Roseococcus sp. DSY-14]|uniref:hypothetical protein n=1 Tax=Roseococcus sp. DSY-14 TaxID=3369650 RepID=UPI00387ACDF9
MFRPRRRAGLAELPGFLHRQAAFVAQKTVLDYCRVKAGRNERRHFADRDFQAALEHCRWQVFLAAAADLALVLEAALRPHAPGREAALAAGLAAAHAAALREEPAPEAERAALEDALRALPHHLAAAQAAPPRPSSSRPMLAEPVLFATLPVHPEQRRDESPAIRGALRFHLVSSEQEFERRFDVAALAAAIAFPDERGAAADGGKVTSP